MNERICKKFPTDDAKESLMLESIIVGKRQNAGIWLKEETDKNNKRRKGRLIRESIIDYPMEEINQKGGA
jgi:hypothetical protein